MTQTTGRFFDELGKLITDAAGAAQGVRKEIESVVRAQAENILRELDIVQREEFEAVKAMAQKAREENEQLKQRIALLEEVLDELEDEVAEPPTPRLAKQGQTQLLTVPAKPRMRRPSESDCANACRHSVIHNYLCNVHSILSRRVRAQLVGAQTPIYN